MKPLKDTPDSSTALTDVETHTPKPANTHPDPSAPPVQTVSTEFEDEPSDPFPSITPSKSWSPAVGSAHKSLERVQFLRQSMTKRFSSVDSSWLARCHVFDEVEEPQKPVAGNSELSKIENSVLRTTVKSETASNEGQTSPKASLEKKKSSLSEDGVQKGPVASLVRNNVVVVDAELGSLGPDGEQVYQKNTAALMGDDEACSEEPKSTSNAKKRKPRARKAQDSDDRAQTEGGKKTKGRKRQRVGDDDVDESEEQEGGVKKRRRTKKGEAAGEDQPKKRGKRKGKVEEEDDTDSSEEKNNPETSDSSGEFAGRGGRGGGQSCCVYNEEHCQGQVGTMSINYCHILFSVLLIYCPHPEPGQPKTQMATL